VRRQLVTVALATTLTVTIAFVIPLALVVRALATARALDDANRIAQTLIPVLVSGDESAEYLAVEQVRGATSATVSVFTPERVLGAPVSDADVEEARAGRAIVKTDADGARVALTPVVSQNGDTSVIRVAVPANVLTTGVMPAWLTLGAVGVALVAIAVLIADRLGRRAVMQATAVAAAARRLASGDRSARAPDGGTPELADAANALNTLADRIDVLLAAEREAAADVSHRLRTPMTALRLDVDALPPSPATERVVHDLFALDVAVDQVIRAARGAADSDGAVADAGRVTWERSEFWGALAQDEDRPWHCETANGDLTVPVGEERLSVVLDALLGNVLSHTDPPAWCHISVARERGNVCIRIDDGGPGFDAAAIARGRSGGGSTGLGLDIARRTAEAAGGSLNIGGSGRGGRVDLHLPWVGTP
jgi:signal transduction histidine kinase